MNKTFLLSTFSIVSLTAFYFFIGYNKPGGILNSSSENFHSNEKISRIDDSSYPFHSDDTIVDGVALRVN